MKNNQRSRLEEMLEQVKHARLASSNVAGDKRRHRRVYAGVGSWPTCPTCDETLLVRWKNPSSAVEVATVACAAHCGYEEPALSVMDELSIRAIAGRIKEE